MNNLDAIERRISIRSYTNQQVAAEELELLEAAVEEFHSFCGADARILVDRDGQSVESGLTGLFGNYGKLFTAPHYGLIAVEDTSAGLVEAGYKFEQLILKATSMGLGTCWIGGLFKESRLARALDLPEGHRVVAVSPIGHPSGSGPKSFLMKGMRAAFKSSTRRPLEEVFSSGEGDEPLAPEVLGDEKMMAWFEAIRRAPSWANKQPCRFRYSPEGLTVVKSGQQMKEGKDYHLVDCGIAMAHVHLAARDLGLRGTWVGHELPEEPVLGLLPVATYRLSQD